MDELQSFGRLSTSAKEWKPSSLGDSVSGSSNSSSIYKNNISSQGSNGISMNASIPTTPTMLSKHSSSYTMMASSTPVERNLPNASIISHAPTSPGLPLSPTITVPRSPMRSSGLLPSPPGRIAWQQEFPASNNLYGDENYVNPYASSENNWLRTSSMTSHDLPIWPEASNNVQYQDEYNIDNGSNTWQPTGPASIPSAPPLPPPVSSLYELPDELWHYFRDLSLDTQREMDVSDPRNKAIPPMYGNAFPLDIETKSTRSSFGYPMSTYKVVSREDGYVYCLRRVDNVKGVSHTIAAAVTERWATAITMRTRCPVLDHPGLVRFVRCFVAHRALFFIHHYCPGARTLRERLVADPSFWSESLLWSAISQLVAAIRAVHGSSMACRTLHLNHVLCQGIGRIRLKINALGIMDALEFESRKKLEDLQMEDMKDLGRLLMSLATGSEITKKSDSASIRRCDIFISQNFSPELHSLIFSLLQPNKPPPSIYDISNKIAAHTMDELERQQLFLDRTEEALRAEYDSSRALRLLIKLGFVNERPELGMNRRWKESGDCYILKLFRDYVFHQADDAGNPIMDLGHIVTSLNKLDAAVEDEQIVLASRDGKTLLIVTYADVARSLEKAYTELCQGSNMLHHGLQHHPY